MFRGLGFRVQGTVRVQGFGFRVVSGFGASGFQGLGFQVLGLEIGSEAFPGNETSTRTLRNRGSQVLRSGRKEEVRRFGQRGYRRCQPNKPSTFGV